MEAAFAYLYEQRKPRVDELLIAWENHRVRQIEAELKSAQLALLAPSLRTTDVLERQMND